MSLVADPGCALGIHADTESDTIVVLVDRPVDNDLLARIREAVAPLVAVHPAKVELQLGSRRAVLDVA